MLKYTLFVLALALLSLEKSLAFVAQPQGAQAPALSMSQDDNGEWKKTAASAAVGAFLLFTLNAPAPAFAYDSSNSADVTLLLAGRSGGRMGGRSSMGTRSYSRPSAPRTSYSRTTVVRPASPAVIVAPPISPFGFGYNPFFSPFGMGYGIGGGIGGAIRDAGQDRELAQDRVELEQARLQNQQLEQRLSQLEAQQRAPPALQTVQQSPELQEQAKKNAELEAQLKQLEAAQKGGQSAGAKK